MIQDAIKTLATLQDKYENAYSLEIFIDGSMIINYMEDPETDVMLHEDFNNAQELLEWMEKNLMPKQ